MQRFIDTSLLSETRLIDVSNLSLDEHSRLLECIIKRNDIKCGLWSTSKNALFQKMFGENVAVIFLLDNYVKFAEDTDYTDPNFKKFLQLSLFGGSPHCQICESGGIMLKTREMETKKTQVEFTACRKCFYMMCESCVHSLGGLCPCCGEINNI